MGYLKEIGEDLNQVGQATQRQLQQFARGDTKEVTLKKLRGGFLLGVGYLLSPLCWWNDLFFNLPVAYFFGYVCSWFSPNLFLPCSIAGYWFSNIAGILLMQVGAVDVFQGKSERNLKKDLLVGVVSSTVYTLVILALVQSKIIGTPALFSSGAAMGGSISM